MSYSARHADIWDRKPFVVALMFARRASSDRMKNIHVAVRSHFSTRSGAEKFHSLDGFATKHGLDCVSNPCCGYGAHINRFCCQSKIVITGIVMGAAFLYCGVLGATILTATQDIPLLGRAVEKYLQALTRSPK